MDHWTQAIYEVTGIPIDAEDLALVFADGQYWLEFHHVRVWPVGAHPDPQVVRAGIRAGLFQAMERRLAEGIPQVERLLEALDPDTAAQVTVSVVNATGSGAFLMEEADFERGWPHFLLRLTAAGFDVEVDLNPYLPDTPFELEELQRQADVILQVARAS